MVEAAVALPEPRPEDDEDVVWGLSTASALWARGERRDAIVWLRRAAEAAVAAGQDFRASELGMYAGELEDTLNSMAATPPPALVGEDTEDTLPEMTAEDTIADEGGALSAQPVSVEPIEDDPPRRAAAG